MGQHGGGIGFEENLGFSREQKITVMGTLDHAAKLVADIEGLIVELCPATPEIFDAFMRESLNSERLRDPTRFIGLDVFHADAPSVRTLEEADNDVDFQAKIAAKA